MKTEDQTQQWSRRVASYALAFVGLFMALVSVCMPFMNARVAAFWFSLPNLYYLLPIPVVTALLFGSAWVDLHRKKAEYKPFLTSVAIFLLGYVGLCLSIFPWIVPFQYTLWDAAASGPGLSLMLVGVVPLLPLILGYTGYCYYIFRGKSGHEHMY
jgi:cytochrome d ubiquinol oxidase subunit II